MMKEQVIRRLGELKAEYETGQKMLADLDVKQANIRTTLLRISGAIQALDEIIAAENKSPDIGSLPVGNDCAIAEFKNTAL